MDNYLKRLPLALFGAYTIKLLVLGATLSDAPIILVLAAVYAYNENKAENKKINELSKQIQDLRTEVQEASISAKDAKTAVSGLKLSYGFKPSAVK